MPTPQELTKLNTKRIKDVILVIDDTPDQLLLQKTILETKDYEVFAASGGSEALEILRETTPKLILLDMQMQDMSGAEFLNELEDAQPKILDSVPVVFVTAMDDIPVSKAVGCIRKPFDIDVFLSDVQHYIKDRPPTQH